MRAAPILWLEQRRCAGPPNTRYGGFRDGPRIIVVSAGLGWEHVSISRADRCPTWDEMDAIKRRLFSDEEVVMQLHVTDHRKVNVHKTCLHLWRPQTAEEITHERAIWERSGEPWPYGDLSAAPPIPLPPTECV